MSRDRNWTSGDKRVESVDRWDEPDPAPGPSPEVISIHTADEWCYRFRRLTPHDAFELVHKRDPESRISPCRVVPQQVAEHFDETPGIALTNALVMEHR